MSVPEVNLGLYEIWEKLRIESLKCFYHDFWNSFRTDGGLKTVTKNILLESNRHYQRTVLMRFNFTKQSIQVEVNKNLPLNNAFLSNWLLNMSIFVFQLIIFGKVI